MRNEDVVRRHCLFNPPMDLETVTVEIPALLPLLRTLAASK